MNKLELIHEIKEMLQTEMELTEELQLSDIEEWDSLAVIGTISLFDQLFSISVSSRQVNDCQSVNDLIKLVDAKLEL